MFANRQLIIATKHAKDSVIKPLLESGLGVVCIENKLFDTDTLGTFSGEVERTEDPLATLRNKCLIAMDKHNCELGIATEGSFGPHPSLFFANANDELMIFIDKKNSIEVVQRELSLATNFNGQKTSSISELKEFAKKAKFPSHGVILRDAKDSFKTIIKDIKNWNILYKHFNEIIAKYGEAFIETDMRAMNNPSRMKVIKKLTKKLLQNLKSTCPKCSFPGFSIKDLKRGLPCKECGMPTKSTLAYIYLCNNCNHSATKMYPLKKMQEEAMYCDFCNP